mmetsp:Transcript_28505/g.42776  ORF Transcript_28505/g.42776 Transcript_28505/m.42776 type:complete len:84 (+) Transcript_28505:274-525(+)
MSSGGSCVSAAAKPRHRCGAMLWCPTLLCGKGVLGRCPLEVLENSRRVGGQIEDARGNFGRATRDIAWMPEGVGRRKKGSEKG